MTSMLPDIALIGGTGSTGGWVIETAIERGHQVRALTSDPSLLSTFASKAKVIAGSCSTKSALQDLIYDDGDKLLVETVVCVMAETSIVQQMETAKVLSELLASKETKPRVVWTAPAMHDELQQAITRPEDAIYPTKSTKTCFDIVPKLDLSCFFPFLQQPVEERFAEDESLETSILESLATKAVLVRPSTSLEETPYAVFTSEWRIQGGDNSRYELFACENDNVEKHPAISRRALAAAVLDLIIDESRDGSSVVAVQLETQTRPMVAESVEL